MWEKENEEVVTAGGLQTTSGSWRKGVKVVGVVYGG